VTPEALAGYSSVTEAGESVQAAMDQYPVGGLVLFKENITKSVKCRMNFTQNKFLSARRKIEL